LGIFVKIKTLMKNSFILSFFLISSAIFAQAPYSTPTFSYSGQVYKVSRIGEEPSYIVIRNTLNKAGTFSPMTGNYLDCSPSQVFDVRYLIQKAKEAINEAIDAQERYEIRNNETFDIKLTVTKENKVEVSFYLQSNTIITPKQIYAMDMAIRNIPITFNPIRNCEGINLSSSSIGISFLPSLD
jgi:hypothetical protein